MIETGAILITMFFVIFATAVIDAQHIGKKEYIDDHTSRVVQRLAINIGWFFVGWQFGLIFGLLFWALFDTILNLLRGLPFFYKGTTAKIDKKLRNSPFILYGSKVLALVIIIFLLSL